MPENKKHPWRICPIGEHWVVTHPRNLPQGPGTTEVEGHCRLNPSKRDRMRAEEIFAIAKRFFSKKLKEMPSSDDLGYPHNKGNPYDHLIAGWTQYWNDIFLPDIRLDPNLVKALIGSESSFRLKPPAQKAGAAGIARGLLQITDQAIQVLKDDKSVEIQDHLLELSRADANDPEIQICAGIRWLFHKRKLASNRLKREATWDEAVAEYKAYLPKILKKDPAADLKMKPFRDDYVRLKSGKK